jgi:signal peptidase I
MTSVQLGSAPPSESKAEKVRRFRRLFRWYVTFPFLLFLVALIALFTTNFIPSASMEPTIREGDHILTMRAWIAYPFGRMPSRGDIIVFRLPQEKVAEMEQQEGVASSNPEDPASPLSILKTLRDNILIKRVIALPGETVQITGGKVLVNGKPLQEDYPLNPLDPDFEPYYAYAVNEPLKVPPGELFVLGDNRNNSDDGRMWGTLHRKDVLGRYIMVLYHEREGGRNREKADAQKAREQGQSQ